MLHRLTRFFAYKPAQVPFKDWKIVRGDKVELITGKDKGKQGTVSMVKRKLNTVVVSGVNMVRSIQKIKHVKNPQRLEGGRVQKEFPVHVSNVMLIDPETG